MLESTNPTDFDTQWKLVITAYFEDFIAFFLPELYRDVDFTIEPEFLDKELHELIADKYKTGKKEVDKLAKLWLKNGKEKWIFVHIEVQSYHDKNFGERMLVTYYRIRERKGKKITALAIFTDYDRMPSQFGEGDYGTELTYKYNAYYVVLDRKRLSH